jgi:hypothetical protein
VPQLLERHLFEQLLGALVSPAPVGRHHPLPQFVESLSHHSSHLVHSLE